MDETRTAALFKNAKNLAVRIPREWISPDGDVTSVVMTRIGETITITPVREDPDPLAAVLSAMERNPVPEHEWIGWDDNPDGLASRPVDL